MSEKRLVKVALPSRLVTAMDMSIEGDGPYASRQTFIADAIENHLADMEVESVPPSGNPAPQHRAGAMEDATAGRAAIRTAAVGSSATQVDDESEAEMRRPISAIDPTEAVELARVSLPEDDVLRPLGMMPKPSEPTWGLHNRDYPTLWAATRLAAALTQRETVSYQSWLSDTTATAWNMAHSLVDTGIDLSGFPLNRMKPQKSEARFMRFFVGEEAGNGPLFHLGIATVDEYGDVGLSVAGAHLLEALDGWTPYVDRASTSPGLEEFLAHLAARAPADFDLLHDVVRAISEGIADRERLVEALKAGRNWSDQTASTNVAGYIGRARQLDLIQRKQENRRYILMPDSLDLLDEIAEQRQEDWRW